MKTNFVEELKWRGMIHDIMPGTEAQLSRETTAGYIGFDPTADSLHIGNLVQIMTLVHFQAAGHKPVVLVGGATGMVGDPSGKSAERNLLSEEQLNHNVACVKAQLAKFLNFQDGENKAELVNNYDWFKNFRFLDFIRDVGKHITINATAGIAALLAEIGVPFKVMRGFSLISRAPGLVGQILEEISNPIAGDLMQLVNDTVVYKGEIA
jgi:tyrosyl-tRNA synthetase